MDGCIVHVTSTNRPQNVADLIAAYNASLKRISAKTQLTGSFGGGGGGNYLAQLLGEGAGFTDVATATVGSPSNSFDAKAAINFLTAGWNPTVNLIGQGTTKTGSTPLSTGCYYKDSAHPSVGTPKFYTYEPNENLKIAYGIRENYAGTTYGDISGRVFSAVASLNSAAFMPPTRDGIPYHDTWNDDSFTGRIIPYSKKNTNIGMDGTTAIGWATAPLGHVFSIFGASPVTHADRTTLWTPGGADAGVPWPGYFWLPTCNQTLANGAINVSTSAIPDGGYQGMNLFLRNQVSLATQTLTNMGKLAYMGSDGCVQFGTAANLTTGAGSPPYTTRSLAAYTQLATLLNLSPTNSRGVTLAQVINSLVLLQAQSGDGSLPDGYGTPYTDTSQQGGDPIESTNITVIALKCPGLQAGMRKIQQSGIYGVTSQPITAFTAPVPLA